MKTLMVRNAILTLMGGALLAGWCGPTAGGQQSKPTAPKPAASSAGTAGKIWVSQTTHHEFRVKIENDLFSAEWVNIPPTSAKLGAYMRTECRRSGTRWIGTSRVLLPCAKPGEAPGKITRTCPMTFRFEVDTITPERISGRGESLKELDCEKCEIRETGWAPYVWVPKK